jgi:hypothetical protein
MIRRILVVLCTMAAVSGGLVPALASPVAVRPAANPIVVGQPYQICQKEDTSQCLFATGNNLQVETVGTYPTDFCYTRQGTFDGVPLYQIYVCDEPEDCVKGDSDLVVRTVECNDADRQQLWAINSDNTYVNDGLTSQSGITIYMSTFGQPQNFNEVLCNRAETGYYRTWYYYAQ